MPEAFVSKPAAFFLLIYCFFFCFLFKFLLIVGPSVCCGCNFSCKKLFCFSNSACSTWTLLGFLNFVFDLCFLALFLFGWSWGSWSVKEKSNAIIFSKMESYKHVRLNKFSLEFCSSRRKGIKYLFQFFSTWLHTNYTIKDPGTKLNIN